MLVWKHLAFKILWECWCVSVEGCLMNYHVSGEDLRVDQPRFVLQCSL